MKFVFEEFKALAANPIIMIFRREALMRRIFLILREFLPAEFAVIVIPFLRFCLVGQPEKLNAAHVIESSRGLAIMNPIASAFFVCHDESFL